MSELELTVLRERLHDTEAMIVKLECALEDDPESLGLQLNLQSVLKRLDELKLDLKDFPGVNL